MTEARYTGPRLIIQTPHRSPDSHECTLATDTLTRIRPQAPAGCPMDVGGASVAAGCPAVPISHIPDNDKSSTPRTPATATATSARRLRQLDVPSAGWRYVGEGRAHIVVHHPGATPTQVLRFAKKVHDCPTSTTSTITSPTSTITAPEVNARFIRGMVDPVLGSELLGSWEYVSVAPKVAGCILAEVEMCRPHDRRCGGPSGAGSDGVAMLLPDWRIPPRLGSELGEHAGAGAAAEHRHRSGSPREPPRSITVEIKPKCGYPSVIDPGTASAKRDGVVIPRCRHCLHQTLKVEDGKWTQKSAYCPVDLFSNEPRKVRRAVTGLVATPQNNLRIFIGNKLVLSDSSQAAERACVSETIARVLFPPPAVTVTQIPDAGNVILVETMVGASGGGLEAVVSVVSEALLTHPILARLVELQQHASNNARDTAEMYHAYRSSAHASVDDRLWGSDGDLAEDPAGDRLRRFIGGMVGKDVSIMLNIQPTSAPGQTASGTSTRVDEGAAIHRCRHFVVRITVLDFSPKRYTYIHTHVHISGVHSVVTPCCLSSARRCPAASEPACVPTYH
eukprot:m.147546 g.147546  ORF g.147546 m.147546 type:complete len:563 (-) comp23151_c0_seq2:164-1852(-)